MRPRSLAFALTTAACLWGQPALPFCGFYVARADARLFNRASQVVLAHSGNRTVMTMASDYQGDPKEFAIVIPVPTFIRREQIAIVDKALLDHMDAYTAPRLVEYFDADPCRRPPPSATSVPRMSPSAEGLSSAKALGVTIEAQYTVGEYDILILSAEQSDGLETWLRQSGYRIPEGASAVLGSYIRQQMRFFVAKVNLGEQAKLGFTYLRPLQVSYESPRFMLPIRLGTVNAEGPQELFVYALSRSGRVETTNYRTVRLPTGLGLPVFVKKEFGAFYKAMFAEQVRKEDMRAVFLEYAWDMGWCDPCAADPLSREELRKLGVSWLEEMIAVPPPSASGQPRTMTRPWRGSGIPVFVTRLHVRYDRDRFPEDLMLQETADRTNFQGRYVLRHPWQGESTCPAVNHYRETLARRQEVEVANLAALTGWDVADIRRKVKPATGVSSGTE